MKHALTLNILSNDTAKLDMLAAEAPVKLDAKVWRGTLDEYSVNRGVTMEGIPCLTAEIRFNTAADRQAAWNKIKTRATSFLSIILGGSWAKFHDCYHDEKLPCINETTVWSK